MFAKYGFLFDIGLFLAIVYIAAVIGNALYHFARVLIGL
jgi:hypothetical protein